MTAQAVLRTGRLRLVPLAEEHLEHEVELDADPAVMRYLGTGRPRGRDEVSALHRQRLAEAERVPGLGFWAGFLIEPPGPFVGWWILGPVLGPDGRPAVAEAELGYRLLPRHWRRGLAGEGARELVRHGFADLGLRRILAQTMAVNTASRATMAAAGLRHERTFHADWDEPIPGTEHGEVEYAITAERWAAG